MIQGMTFINRKRKQGKMNGYKVQHPMKKHKTEINVLKLAMNS